MKTWAEHLFQFYNSLQPGQSLPNGVQWLYPQRSPEVMDVVQRFLHKYFDDAAERTLMLGINPGRFGAGVTGVNFTGPRQLTDDCAITHPFPMRSELSAEFIYTVIKAYGGPEAFYQKFYIASVCPLGFVKGGVNINYYDDKALQQTVEPFILNSMEKMLEGNVNRKLCLCIGEGKNFKYLTKLNEKQQWFGRIIPLPHPRFVMQYRRKTLTSYVQLYVNALAEE